MVTSPGSPADSRAYIVERLVGDTGEPEAVIETARALAERALPAIRSAFAEVLATPVGLEVRDVMLARLAEARPEDPETAALTVGSSPSSPDAVVLTADGAAIAVLVTALFGGDPEQPTPPIARALSPTELQVVELVFGLIAKAINGSGQRAFNFALPLPAAATGTEVAKLVLRDGPAVRADLSVSLGGSAGRISVMMPQRVLLKHRSDRAPAKEKGVPEAEWGARFGEEVMRSAVALEAIMPLGRLTLGEIAALREGMVIDLPETARNDVRLSARQKTLFVCEFGKLGQNYTVRIRNGFDAQQDLLQGLMAG